MYMTKEYPRCILHSCPLRSHTFKLNPQFFFHRPVSVTSSTISFTFLEKSIY